MLKIISNVLISSCVVAERINYLKINLPVNDRMVAIDFQKAFNSVNKKFLYEELSALGFIPSLIQFQVVS